MEYILAIIFFTERGAKTTISISGVKSGISKDQINDLMKTIIEKNIFITKNEH